MQYVIERERKGDYLGKTVQVVPHVTDAIQEWIERVANIPVDGRTGPPDVCVIELGGEYTFALHASGQAELQAVWALTKDQDSKTSA